MIMTSTLGRYLSKRFLIAIFGVLAFLFVMIFLLDFAETSRRASDLPHVSVGSIATLSLLRTPSIIEQTLPFVFLFGAIICFVNLSLRLELVVMRAAGLSVWQFLAPPIICAILLGLLAAMAFNPLSAALKTRSDVLDTRVFGSRQVRDDDKSRWIRDGQAVIHTSAENSDNGALTGVTIYALDADGRFIRRIEADTAKLDKGAWHLSKVQEFIPNQSVKTSETVDFPSNLTKSQVDQQFAVSADSVSFWRLPSSIEQQGAAGLEANDYRLQYQTLLARPLLLVAMVLIAATVSLRFARLGGIGVMILSGIGAGFLLYVVTKMAKDLGIAGLVAPAVAAWTPAAIAALIGFTVLLNQEDG
ncbi:LPS export ABC transporter permease LptG [Labrys sp. KB_33_2]|uniref:LPS export ABC transporter permease LptG n=1 Tax=Labrys sp. KB_33_2 TaxID=3237479 RepID=UPI003F908D5D